jgi:hypothetical protein
VSASGVESVRTLVTVGAIFMFGDGGPVVRDTVEHASSFMEAADVENGEYNAVYDEAGLMFRPQVEGRLVRLISTRNSDHDDLVRRLTDWCRTAGLTLDPASDDFPIQVAQRIAESEWSARWPKRPLWLSRRIHGTSPPTFDGD